MARSLQYIIRIKQWRKQNAEYNQKGEKMIRRAQRSKAKLRLGIAAPSGAGKTYSALVIAFGLGGKVGLIDTEHGSGDLYSHLGEYDIIDISAPFAVQKYLNAIKEFESSGYSTIIIDSLSHAWAGDGGLLDKQGKIADSGKGNSFSAWRQITPEHNALVEAILASKCHVIATMRSKQEYVLERNEKGRQTPKKVGLAPVQRDGMEYEFTVFIDLDQQHNAQATKDRTTLFDGLIFKPSKKTGVTLLKWLDGGVEVKKEEPTKPKEELECEELAAKLGEEEGPKALLSLEKARGDGEQVAKILARLRELTQPKQEAPQQEAKPRTVTEVVEKIAQATSRDDLKTAADWAKGLKDEERAAIKPIFETRQAELKSKAVS
jgi:hypothetical protein